MNLNLSKKHTGHKIYFHIQISVSVSVSAEVTQEGEICSCGGQRAVNKLQQHPH